MDQRSQEKVIEAGFKIIRTQDNPSVIKIKDRKSREWRHLVKFETKSARDKAFEEFLKQPDYICD